MKKIIEECLETSLIEKMLSLVVASSWFVAFMFYKTNYELISMMIATGITALSIYILERKV